MSLMNSSLKCVLRHTALMLTCLLNKSVPECMREDGGWDWEKDISFSPSRLISYPRSPYPPAPHWHWHIDHKLVKGWKSGRNNFFFAILLQELTYWNTKDGLERPFILSVLLSLLHSLHIWTFPSASHPIACFKAWASRWRYHTPKPSSLHRISINPPT